MNFSIRRTIRALAAPNHRLSCSSRLWSAGLEELRHRGRGWRESGAFLLGHNDGKRRTVRRFVYYDDLDPNCLDTGVIVFDGTGYPPLWQTCRETGLKVVADVHTHPGLAEQSPTDRVNPMLARPGHTALIVPNLAQRKVRPLELGIYEYEGNHNWRDYSGRKADEFLYIGIWG